MNRAQREVASAILIVYILLLLGAGVYGAYVMWWPGAEKKPGLELHQKGPDMPATVTPLAPSEDFWPEAWLRDQGNGYRWVASPNHSDRVSDINGIVVHVTAGGTCPSITNTFTNPANEVSAHFLVCPDGTVIQYVALSQAAWHAGIFNKPDTTNAFVAGLYANQINPNRATIGIETLLAPGQKIGDFPAMVKAYDDLLFVLLAYYKLPADAVHVIGHNQIDSVNRAVDPPCCIWLPGSIAYAAERLAPPPPPPPLTLEERVARLEALLGVQ